MPAEPSSVDCAPYSAMPGRMIPRLQSSQAAARIAATSPISTCRRRETALRFAEAILSSPWGGIGRTHRLRNWTARGGRGSSNRRQLFLCSLPRKEKKWNWVQACVLSLPGVGNQSKRPHPIQVHRAVRISDISGRPLFSELCGDISTTLFLNPRDGGLQRVAAEIARDCSSSIEI